MNLMLDLKGLLGKLRAPASGPAAPAAASFVDLFSGSASDPSVDATLWVQNTRTGADTGVAGDKLVCDRVAFNNLGVFAAYTKVVIENGESDVFKLLGAKTTNQESHHLCLWFRHASQSGSYPANGNGDMPDGYELRLHDASWGDVSVLTRWVSGVGSAVGASFTATGLGSGGNVDVQATVSNDVDDNVVIELKIGGSTIWTRTDTNAARIKTPGYSGIAIRSDNTGSDMEIEGFTINL